MAAVSNLSLFEADYPFDVAPETESHIDLNRRLLRCGQAFEFKANRLTATLYRHNAKHLNEVG